MYKTGYRTLQICGEVVPGISRAYAQKRREYPPKMEGRIQRLLQRIHTEIIINLSFYLSVTVGQMWLMGWRMLMHAWL